MTFDTFILVQILAVLWYILGAVSKDYFSTVIGVVFATMAAAAFAYTLF